MVTINLNGVKNILKLAILATLTYLLFTITSSYNVPVVIKFNSEDTSTSAPDYYIK